LIIRKAELKDVPEVAILTKQFFEESLGEYGLTLEDETIDETLSHYITNLIGIVAEKEGRLIGAIGGLVTPSIFDKRQLIGQETIWYVAKDERNGSVGLKLISAFEKECKEKGANLIVMVHMGNLYADVLDKLYKRRNYKLLEQDYIKGV